MDLLLDTHVVFWAGAEPEKLTTPVREALEHRTARVFVSALTAAELACAQERGKMKLKLHWKIWFRKLLGECGWECLPLNLETFEEAFSLPETFHGDPADRLLVATARLHRLRLITADARIRSYPHVGCLW